MESTVEGLQARIERLEALDDIRQLPPKYAAATDMRDFDAPANLFVEDVKVLGGGSGRLALKQWYVNSMRPRVKGSAHLIAGHIIEFQSADLADGLVYSRNELETAAGWVVEIVAYLDVYERHNDTWLFRRHSPLFWYECDSTDPPLGEQKIRWPGEPPRSGNFHDPFPTYAEFWTDLDLGNRPVPPPADAHNFLRTLRRKA